MTIKEFLLKKIPKHPHDVVSVAMQHFEITRPAVHKHLKSLITEGKVIALGATRKTYQLAESDETRFVLPLPSSLSESDLWQQHIKPRMGSYPANIQFICEYGFTEMVNNVIDHSQAKTLSYHGKFSADIIRMVVIDNGIGIFKKLQEAFHLETEREAILQLTKGKLTTDPQRHSGEGIFFTSRIFDRFMLSSGTTQFVRFDGDDWALESTEPCIGTGVIMEINPTSQRTAQEVFNQYADPKNNYSFSKTQAFIELGKNPEETYISRSQAKRILSGLDKFKMIILDFRRVETIGQGFVDEVFRVFQNQYPQIEITYVNANANVEFMIKRSLA